MNPGPVKFHGLGVLAPNTPVLKNTSDKKSNCLSFLGIILLFRQFGFDFLNRGQAGLDFIRQEAA